MNNATISANIDKKPTIEATLNVGLHVMSAYEMAVLNGYTGTLREWVIDSLSPVIADFELDDNGELVAVYEIDKYNFEIDDYGRLIVEIK